MEDKIGNLKSFLYAARVETYQRVGHRAIQIGHNILVFGGTNGQNEFTTNILRTNSQTITVDLILTKTHLKLEEFSLFSYNNHIYLWGGNDPLGSSNKLYKFTGDDFEIVSQGGQIPAPRSHHASYFFSKRYLIIQGGMNSEQFFKDFYILDCQAMMWNKVIINNDIPYSLNTYIFWNGGRGFFMIGQTYDHITRKTNYEYLIYELRFIDAKQFKMNLELLNITQTAMKPIQAKKEPSVILVNFQSPYLMVIGGEIMPSAPNETQLTNEIFNFRDIWIFNLETLEWTPSNVKLLSSGFGSQAVFYQQRLYLIGGVSVNLRELSTTIQVIDINSDCLQAKLCKVCRQMYGFRQYSGYNKQFSIKFEHEETQRTFFTVKTISKLAKFIKHPFSAFGLLIDNSINLNGTLINIQFKFYDASKAESMRQVQNSFLQTGSLLEKTVDEKLKMKYNYIKITDDTCGFTQNEIVQCLCSFGMKTEKLTTDKKYEEELEIRREYGINIKLGALRIAQSCLLVTKTQDDTIFVCYFTTVEEKIGDKFQIVSYFVSERDGRSSDINYEIIHQNVINYLPADYEKLQDKTKTKIYLFNLEQQQLLKEVIDFDTYDITYKNYPAKIFKHLRSYLESLYFTPYTGRLIKLQGQVLKFKNYFEIFKKDEQEKLITKLNINLKDNYFKQHAIYKYNSMKYPIKQILVYHENRLLYPIDTRNSYLCGFIVIPASISIDLCKTKIENHPDEYFFNRFIHGLLSNHNKFLPEYYVDQAKKFFRE